MSITYPHTWVLAETPIVEVPYRDGDEPKTYQVYDIPGFTLSPVDSDFHCGDCGTPRFAVTNRRIACLECSKAGKSSWGLLYPQEVVLGYLDFLDGELHLERPYSAWTPPPAVQDEATNDPSVPVNVAVIERGDFEQYVNPERGDIKRARRAGQAVPHGPNSKPARAYHDKYLWDEETRSFRSKSDLEAEKVRGQARRRPRKGQRFGDDPRLFGDGGMT